MVNQEIFLCAISNISSGRCLEDCKFCTQSIKYKSDINRYFKKNIDLILNEARIAKSNGALGFCLVTSGLSLDDMKLEFVSEIAYKIKKEINGLNLIACNGLATLEQLKELKKVGIDSYNHNLESSKEFYPNICQTHEWEARFQTCLNVKEANLVLCSGGIFGIGESEIDRVSLFNSLKELKPQSSPINFYHPNSSLPLPNQTLNGDEALSIIKLAREILDDVMLMVAGGREITLGEREIEIFNYGANALIIGDYLTTKGKNPLELKEMIEKAGYSVATTCHKE